MIALLYLFGAVLTAFVFFFVCCWVMFERDLNADLPNEIREIGLIENARILSTVVYRYWHNQFLEGTYTKQPPVRDAAYACGSEFSSDLGTAEKNEISKIPPGTTFIDSAPVGSKKYSDSYPLLSLYSVRFTEFGNGISEVLNLKNNQNSRLKTLLTASAFSAVLLSIGFQSTAEELNYSAIPGLPKIELLTGDDRWGCEVLLCLVNPNGPRAVSECKPPIDKLFDCLSWRHPCKFPSCPMAGDGNYASQLNDGFDPCSITGMEDAPQGYIAEGSLNDTNFVKTDRRGTLFLRKRSSSYNWGGEHWFKATEDSPGYWGGTKACVKGFQGTAYEAYTCYQDSGDSSYATTCYRPVRVYEKVTWQKYQSRRAIDVFINGKNWTRVHW